MCHRAWKLNENRTNNQKTIKSKICIIKNYSRRKIRVKGNYKHDSTVKTTSKANRLTLWTKIRVGKKNKTLDLLPQQIELKNLAHQREIKMETF